MRDALVERVARWLTQDEPGAAGRVGVFRIFFCAFYLWQMSRYHAGDIGLWPGLRHRAWSVAWVPGATPPLALELLESVVVAALVLLMIGLRTRLMTGVVLVAGALLEGLHFELDTRNSTVFLVFYIPLFMLLAGSWGHTWSLDAVLRRRRGAAVVSPDASDGRYWMPARAILVVLSALFLSAALLKFVDGGTWLDYQRIMADVVLKANVDAAVMGSALNPLAPWISETPLAYQALRLGALLFEGFFWLALLGPRIRSVLLSIALLFHSVNAIWLTVSFSSILVVYPLWVDWPRLVRHLRLPTLRPRRPLGSAWLIAASVSVALAAGALWNLGPTLRSAVSLGGLVTEATLWLPVLPAASVALVVSLLRLARPLRRA